MRFCIVSFMKVLKQTIEKCDWVDFTFYSLFSQESVNNCQNCLPVQQNSSLSQFICHITAHSFYNYYFIVIVLISLILKKFAKECNHAQPIFNTSETIWSDIVITSYIEHTYINTNGNPEHRIWETLSCLQTAKIFIQIIYSWKK